MRRVRGWLLAFKEHPRSGWLRLVQTALIRLESRINRLRWVSFRWEAANWLRLRIIAAAHAVGLVHSSFSFIAAVGATNDSAGTTLDASAALNVAASDLLVAWGKYEGANGTFACAKNSGSPANTYTFDAGDEVNHANGDLNASFGYVLAAAADSSHTPRLTTDSRAFRRLIVAQFRPDAGEAAVKDASNVGSGTSSAMASGNISTSGTDEVVCAGYGEYTSSTTINEQINGVAATEPAGSPQGNASLWYRLLTSTFTNGNATADQSPAAGAAWILNIIAFRAEAGGGPASGDFGFKKTRGHRPRAFGPGLGR